jgi:hypothetical protein
MQPQLTPARSVPCYEKAARALDILRDDIRWLEYRIRELYDSHGERERRLADCYQKLLRQRRQQLSAGDGRHGAFAACWNDYFC